MSDLRQRAHGDDGRWGIWFHRYELMRVDEFHESARELLLNIERPEPCRGPHEAPVLPQGRRRRDGTTLLQRETPGNRGRLPGSAAATGSTPASWPPSAPSTSRNPTGRSGSEILLRPLRPQARRRARPERRAARLARKFAHALSFFCPSCYIPGKQEWGAFWLVGTSLLRCSATRKNPWPNV